MIFGIMLLVLAGAIAFFHYTQGFFSAAISAILAIVATVVAIGYHESLAGMLVGKFPETAAAMSIAILFAAAYILPRLAFDAWVPGNVQFPVLVDKIGAGVMGAVVGLLATGVVAVAAQTLPMGPSIGGYARYKVLSEDKTGQYLRNNQQWVEVPEHELTSSDDLNNANDMSSLILQQDDLVMGLTRKVSNGGSMAGDVQLSAIHPDYLLELFGQRIGIQLGARHTLVSSAANETIKFKGVFTQPKLAQVDGETPKMRLRSTALPPTLEPKAGQVMLIARLSFPNSKDIADDADSLLRFSMGNIRMVVSHVDPDGITQSKDYNPVATLDPRGVAVYHRVDDFCFSDLKEPRTIDFIFIVDNDSFLGDAKAAPYTLNEGAFIEIKRYGRVDLSGKKVDFGPPTNSDITPIVNKPEVDHAIKTAKVIELKTPGSAGETGDASTPADSTKTGPGTVLGDTGLAFQSIDVSAKLFAPIDVHNGNPNADISLPAAKGTIADRKWTKLTVTTDQTLKDLDTPADEIVDEIAVPSGDVMVQVHCKAPTTGTPQSMWNWTSSVADFELSESGGTFYKAMGVQAQVLKPDPCMAAEIGVMDSSGSLTAMSAQNGRPTDVIICFVVHQGAQIQQLKYKGTVLLDGIGFTAR